MNEVELAFSHTIITVAKSQYHGVDFGYVTIEIEQIAVHQWNRTS